MLKKIFNLTSSQQSIQIILGMILGILVGHFYGAQISVLKPIGSLFINSLLMLVPVLVFVSIVSGIVAISDPIKMGRIAMKSMSWYVVTMMVGTILALFLSQIFFESGCGICLSNLNLDGAYEHSKVSSVARLSLADFVKNLLPANIFNAFIDVNLIQIIVFAVLFGLAIQKLGKKVQPVVVFIESLSVVLTQVLQMVIKVAPIGVFALMAVVAGTNGLSMILSLLKLVAVIYLCMLLMMFVVYSCILFFGARLNPLIFFKKMFEVQLVGFSTTSSMATLPVNIRVAQDKLGVSSAIAGFVLPFGATVNMNGMSTYLGVIAIFAAKLFGIDLSIFDMGVIVLTSTLAAIGSAGVPAAGVIVMPMVLSSVGIPLDIMGILIAINRIVDMASTALNISGDTLTAVMVAKSEGEFCSETYYQKEEFSSVAKKLSVPA
jgi:Na+/H+-dicarboxylate symporter